MKIKLSELRQIVKSILRENPDPTPTGPSTPNLAAELAKMKNVPVRWYSDEENTKGYNVMTIKNIIPGSNSTSIEGVFEDSTTISKVFLICQNNFVILRSADSANTKLYNKKYVEKLKALLCTKSAGGVEVTNIGDYSSTTSKAPMNVAESKLRKIVKSVIRENPDPTPNTMDMFSKEKREAFFDKAAFVAKVKPLIGQKVRLYNDEANTDEIGVNKITNIENESDDHITITLDGGTNHFCIWACGMKFLSYTYGTESAQFANNKVYNKSLIAQLDKILCTTNSGGKRVMNIGPLSQTNQKAPVNVAESKRKLTNVIRQVVKEISLPGYAGGTYTTGKGGNTAFNNAGKGGASIIPEDIFAKILPCLADFGVKTVADFEKKYPNVFKIVNKMSSDVMMGGIPKPPNMLEAGLAFNDIMSSGIDLKSIAELMSVFTCILDKMKVLNERKYYY